MAAQVPDGVRFEVDEIVRVRRFEEGKVIGTSLFEKAEAEALGIALNVHTAEAFMSQVKTDPAQQDSNTPVLETPCNPGNPMLD